MASAQRREEARIASGVVGESPLPATCYDQERGDYDLLAVSLTKLDLDLRTFTDDFMAWEPDRRSEAMRVIPYDDLYTLIHFVKRASILALNQDPLEWCRAGLVALSMIDEARVDWRDVKWSAGLLEHTLVTVPGVTNSLLKDIGRIPSSTVAFISQLPKMSHLREWGYAEIKRGNSVGLVQTSYSNYNPTLDVTGIAIQISEQLTKGRYIGQVEIATEIPVIWFDRKQQRNVRQRLTDCLGAASINGTLRKAYGESFNQMFVVWVIEMPSSNDCEYLVDAVGSGNPLSGRYAVGVSEGKLFALFVAGSIQEGFEPFESLMTLQELAEQMRSLLKA